MQLKRLILLSILLLFSDIVISSAADVPRAGIGSPIATTATDTTTVSKAEYLSAIKAELKKRWPDNRTVNIVFHGHSVPSGYITKGKVHKYEAYPHLTGTMVTQEYPYAVINIITTSIGGENATGGAPRFKEEVLTHRPDIVFIDYALNDRGPGLEEVKSYWEQMIREALDAGVKVILMTPTPDLREDILSDDAPLAEHAAQIRMFANKYEVGLVDSYKAFKKIAKNDPLEPYMAQNNHINSKGHKVVAEKIMEWF
jgi:lysophospholipase L1-like esterase